MDEFRLEVADYENLCCWRWVLTEAAGRFVDDFQVRLDRDCWQYEAFGDLHSYLRWRVAPDRRIAHEAEIVADVGRWIGAHVLGPVASALAASRPAAVRVILPDEPLEARELGYRPLELAYADGKPLAVQGISMITQIGDRPGRQAAVRDRLRVLGLFSMPLGAQPLNLRRERHAMVRLVDEITRIHGKAVDLRVLQFGVSRQRLREELEQAEGWDIIHISGHGLPGELLLETEDGRPDPVDAAELAGLLDLARERLSLVSVFACWSASAVTAEHFRALGLRADPGPMDDPSQAVPAPPANLSAALATELVDRLGCAVLAMRYPVVDDFAIGLSEHLYSLLVGKGQPLPRALSIALPQVVASPPTSVSPALSVATPALFGARAAGLRLAAPQRSGPGFYGTSELKLARFPDEPDRFVGRTGVMARASSVLAPRSGCSGLVLHGMPGAGKTACALELAYTHEHAFEALAWFAAPPEGHDIASALVDLALVLERTLPGLEMAHLVDDAERLKAFLPEMTELFERRRILLVIDNAESLLTEAGHWRDPRWAQVIRAITGHSGLGRMILTTPRQPTDLDARVAVETIDALSVAESVLLARELPNLRALLDGQLSGMAFGEAQALAAQVLTAAQGHPSLLELADGQAADLDQLQRLLAAGERAWGERGGIPDGFFVRGEPQARGEDYLHLLSTWTTTALGTLTQQMRDMFLILCCLEDQDRHQFVLDAARTYWPALWEKLIHSRPLPGRDEFAEHLQALGLAGVKQDEEHGETYVIHPAIAAAGRVSAGPGFQAVVDEILALFWCSWQNGHENEAVTSAQIVVAGLAAVPYLLRLSQRRPEVRAGLLDIARSSLDLALVRERSRAMAAAVLPSLRALAAALTGTERESYAIASIARALQITDPAAAEPELRAQLQAAEARKDYPLAITMAFELIGHYLDHLRLHAALKLADESIAYADQGKLGEWTRLMAEHSRLKVLTVMSEVGNVQPVDVLDELHHLLDRAARINVQPELGEPEPWMVREGLLTTGAEIAQVMERWAEALDLNGAVTASMRSRGAPENVVAGARFHDYQPLIELGRFDDALALLRQCRDVFERQGDVLALSRTLSALVVAEDARGHSDVAFGLAHDALRYSYLTGHPSFISASHSVLSRFLTRAGQAEHAVAHLLAAVLIGAHGIEGRTAMMARLISALRCLGLPLALPDNTAGLIAQLGEPYGQMFAGLLPKLSPDRLSAEQMLKEIIDDARMFAMGSGRIGAHLASWDPLIAAMLVAHHGDVNAAELLDRELAVREQNLGLANLISVLRRIRRGDSGSQYFSGLDPFYTVIAWRALDVLAGRVVLPAELWKATPCANQLGIVVAAYGDSEAAARARRVLTPCAVGDDQKSLVPVLERILAGDTRSQILTDTQDPVLRAVIVNVFEHIAADTPPLAPGRRSLEESGSTRLKPPSAARKETVQKNRKVSRNSPCPCGSRRKYKRCCGGPPQTRS